MPLSSVLGQFRSWNLLEKLGEGDAGEVYLVESLLDKKQAVLKCPRRSAFASDIIRQATQIENEGRILRGLAKLNPSALHKFEGSTNKIHLPELLDQSPAGSEFSERFFIVMEKAKGISLDDLAKVTRLGSFAESPETPEDDKFLKTLAEIQRFPRLILLRSLIGIFQLFETIHQINRLKASMDKSGMIWNDVKPAHVYWDNRLGRVTFIDWGNAQFLDIDGYSKDRRYSKNDDYIQFIDSLGSFLRLVDPDLSVMLNWPEQIMPVQSIKSLARPIKEKLLNLLSMETKKLQEIRERESTIIDSSEPSPEDLSSLSDIQNQITLYGEVPDYLGYERFYMLLAGSLLRAGRLEDFKLLHEFSHQMYADSQAKWQLINEIAELLIEEDSGENTSVRYAISAGLANDWAALLWGLLSATANRPEPPWWDKVCGDIREIGLPIDATALPPLVVLNRSIMTLQAALSRLKQAEASANQDNEVTSHLFATLPTASQQDPKSEGSEYSQRLELLIKTLKEEVSMNWDRLDPDPPYSTLEYDDIDQKLPEIQLYAPDVFNKLTGALEQPKIQVSLVFDAWNRKDFAAAQRYLRQLLLWDPDRRRVLTADRAIARTSTWLGKIKSGPQQDQAMLEFVTEFELIGREIRSQVGPADWLDRILNAFSALRKNRKPGEIIIEFPDLKFELPWLESLEPYRFVSQENIQPIVLDREPTNQQPEPFIHGVHKGTIGEDFILADPLDTWAPEARGSSARVFVGFIRNSNNQLKQAAIKVMRHDRVDYALPLFREEIQILEVLRDVPGITPLQEFGFLKLAEGASFPSDHTSNGARSVMAEILRYGPEQAASFLSDLETKIHQGWLAYLATPKLDNRDNLMWLCDAGFTKGRFLPITESLRLGIQICDLIQTAHERHIVYRDHKLLHYYWQPIYNGVFMIDWNVARLHPEGLSESEVEFDLVQLGARALHHIFTGRVAPGALADGPNPVEEIEAAAHTYRTQWTYDDQRLPQELKEVLEQVLTGGYSQATNLKNDLIRVYNNILQN